MSKNFKPKQSDVSTQPFLRRSRSSPDLSVYASINKPTGIESLRKNPDGFNDVENSADDVDVSEVDFFSSEDEDKIERTISSISKPITPTSPSPHSSIKVTFTIHKKDRTPTLDEDRTPTPFISVRFLPDKFNNESAPTTPLNSESNTPTTPLNSESNTPTTPLNSENNTPTTPCSKNKESTLDEVRMPTLNEVRMPTLNEDRMPTLDEVRMPTLDEVRMPPPFISKKFLSVKFSNESAPATSLNSKSNTPTTPLNSESNTPTTPCSKNKESTLNEDRMPTLDEVRTPTLNEDRTPTLNEDRTPTLDEVRTLTLDEVRTPTLNEDRTPTLNEVRTPTLDEIRMPPPFISKRFLSVKFSNESAPATPLNSKSNAPTTPLSSESEAPTTSLNSRKFPSINFSNENKESTLDEDKTTTFLDEDKTTTAFDEIDSHIKKLLNSFNNQRKVKFGLIPEKEQKPSINKRHEKGPNIQSFFSHDVRSSSLYWTKWKMNVFPLFDIFGLKVIRNDDAFIKSIQPFAKQMSELPCNLSKTDVAEFVNTSLDIADIDFSANLMFLQLKEYCKKIRNRIVKISDQSQEATESNKFRLQRLQYILNKYLDYMTAFFSSGLFNQESFKFSIFTKFIETAFLNIISHAGLSLIGMLVAYGNVSGFVFVLNFLDSLLQLILEHKAATLKEIKKFTSSFSKKIIHEIFIREYQNQEDKRIYTSIEREFECDGCVKSPSPIVEHMTPFFAAIINAHEPMIEFLAKFYWTITNKLSNTASFEKGVINLQKIDNISDTEKQLFESINIYFKEKKPQHGRFLLSFKSGKYMTPQILASLANNFPQRFNGAYVKNPVPNSFRGETTISSMSNLNKSPLAVLITFYCRFSTPHLLTLTTLLSYYGILMLKYKDNESSNYVFRNHLQGFIMFLVKTQDSTNFSESNKCSNTVLLQKIFSILSNICNSGNTLYCTMNCFDITSKYLLTKILEETNRKVIIDSDDYQGILNATTKFTKKNEKKEKRLLINTNQLVLFN